MFGAGGPRRRTGAGSDLSGVATRAERDGDDFVLTGAKTYITNIGVADFYTVLARTSAIGGPSLETAFGLRLQHTSATGDCPFGYRRCMVVDPRFQTPVGGCGEKRMAQPARRV